MDYINDIFNILGLVFKFVGVFLGFFILTKMYRAEKKSFGATDADDIPIDILETAVDKLETYHNVLKLIKVVDRQLEIAAMRNDKTRMHALVHLQTRLSHKFGDIQKRKESEYRAKNSAVLKLMEEVQKTRPSTIKLETTQDTGPDKIFEIMKFQENSEERRKLAVALAQATEPVKIRKTDVYDLDKKRILLVPDQIANYMIHRILCSDLARSLFQDRIGLSVIIPFNIVKSPDGQSKYTITFRDHYPQIDHDARGNRVIEFITVHFDDTNKKVWKIRNEHWTLDSAYLMHNEDGEEKLYHEINKMIRHPAQDYDTVAYDLFRTLVLKEEAIILKSAEDLAEYFAASSKDPDKINVEKMKQIEMLLKGMI